GIMARKLTYQHFQNHILRRAFQRMLDVPSTPPAGYWPSSCISPELAVINYRNQGQLPPPRPLLVTLAPSRGLFQCFNLTPPYNWTYNYTSSIEINCIYNLTHWCPVSNYGPIPLNNTEGECEWWKGNVISTWSIQFNPPVGFFAVECNPLMRALGMISAGAALATGPAAPWGGFTYRERTPSNLTRQLGYMMEQTGPLVAIVLFFGPCFFKLLVKFVSSRLQQFQ
ncbi:hypothetical protein E2I00_018402, partial [Balaenoptera physalus]